MKLGIVVQTNNGWRSLRERCMGTWVGHAKNQGYEVRLIDFSMSNATFPEILLDEMESNNFDYVGVNFDDLFFREFFIPESKTLGLRASELGVDYFRTDGRAPGDGEVFFTLDGIAFRDITATRYKFSTVLGFFSRPLLKKMIHEGVTTAWGIESYMDDDANCLAPSVRLVKYNNLLVKGELDLLAIYLSGLNIGLLRSLIRSVYRKINALRRAMKIRL